ncbi:sam-dependent methyltransferase [hydrocarbon metagenome]|uniref:Sam-dependent methyltransferase n=1 Tax=hydrocarbon metagenome TaxID=938273 RepID=A0A0W8E2X5_9ZZZZ
MQSEGNYFDKYKDNGKIINSIMNGFFKNLECLLNGITYDTVYEAGCGEGHISHHVYNYNRQIQRTVKITASDLSENIIRQAKVDFPHILFKVESIYSLNEEEDSYDLVIASEVLEHLDQPENALKEIFRISNRYVLISVPNEPIWCIANMVRGKYIRSMGNTPGHIKHWSRRGIVDLISNFGYISKVSTPFPWTMILSEKK